MIHYMLSQLVSAHNEQATELRKCGVDAYVISDLTKRGGCWQARHTWGDGFTQAAEYGTLRDLWGALEDRLAMNEMKLEERVK